MKVLGHLRMERCFRWANVNVEVETRAIHRPRFSLNRVFRHLSAGFEFHPTRLEVSVSWGDPSCDPVWLVDVEVPAPRWLVDRVPW